MSTAEAIYELAKTLPEEQANTVLRFAEFLRQESRVAPVPPNTSNWSLEFLALYGSCADDEIELDEAGILDAMDDNLIGVFDA